MLSKTEKFMEQYVEIKEELFKMCFENVDMYDLEDDTTIKAMKLMVKLLKMSDAAMELSMEQAKTIDEMNKKLDKLLESKN